MVPEFDQSGKLWRAAVLAKKQEILHEKTKHMPTGSDVRPNAYNFEPNVVKVVDREYINRFFDGVKPVDGDIIRCVITEYSLNDEQERAFRIIANQCHLEESRKSLHVLRRHGWYWKVSGHQGPYELF
jgi:hypothetical protein